MKIKKIAAILIVIVTVAIMGIGCDDTVSKVPKVTKSEYENLDISNISYNKSTQIVSYKLVNEGNYNLTTGYPFIIEKYDDKNGWSRTDLTDELAFIEIAIVLEGNNSYTESIDLSKIRRLKDGYYRIVKEYSSEKEKIVQYIQFEVSDNDLINLESYNKIN
ncbi:MAG: immunoglobulin-like domain-containing protein [Peptostreptococcaceae bacterium]